MYGTKIEQVNKVLAELKKDIINDDLARKRVEIAVITFGRKVKVMNEFLSIEEFIPNPFEVNRSMAEAISLAIDLIEQRKKEYKSNGVDYYRPWIFLVTDGKLDDITLGCSQWDEIIERVHDGEINKKFSFFAMGIEPANMDILKKISPLNRPAIMLKEIELKDMFVWLSSSLQAVSRSRIGEQIILENPVAPTSWGKLEDEQISLERSDEQIILENPVAPAGWSEMVDEQISFEDPVAPTGWGKLEGEQILLEDSVTSIGWVDIENVKLKLKENEI